MIQRHPACGWLLAGLLYGAAAGSPLLAEDTEIYVGLASTQSGAQPNVLFVIDTSGSMNSKVTITAPTPSYDPSVVYPGRCRRDRIYWSSSGATPKCSTRQYFPRNKLRCSAATTALDLKDAGVGVGFYQDRVARWSTRGTDRWRSLSTKARNPPHVECKADNGRHGETAGDARTYIKNQRGRDTYPWTSNPSQGISWSSTGRFYTLYSGNYLNFINNSGGSTTTTRIALVKQVVKDLVDANNGLNVGLMRFDTRFYWPGANRGGPVIYPITDIDQPGVKTAVKSAVDSLSASGWTPLAETMYEALRYYRGGKVVYGKSPNAITSVPSSLDPSDPSRYASPIQYECQKNFIVYLTDGDPTYDSDADALINADLAAASGLTLGGCNYWAGDDCLDELAELLYESDNATAALGNDLANKQNVITYTVGFATDQALLNSAASKGGGKYYVANDALELSSAFTQIITEIQAVNTTFTAPAVSVNAFNRVTHRKELYFTLFKPAATPHWNGNVKRFELDYVRDGNGNPVDSNGDGIPDPPEILDVNGVPAVDPNTGFFKGSATSFWTLAADAPDGDETAKGGAASKLPDPPSTRRVYTNVATSPDLSDPSNALHESNTLITDGLLELTGASGEPSRNTLLSWARGVDVNDEDLDGSTSDGRRVMGDPLHSKPVLVTYGGTDASPDITMFVITNDGYLHAIDVDDGTEVFSFVPKELLGKLKVLYQNVGTGSTHNYGLDGGVEVWVKDHNGNGQIETPDSDGNTDHVYLYFGQRRGGSNYYALDVTDRNAPRLLWHIQGGLSNDAFEELGQTWSQPKHHRIKVRSGRTLVGRDVLVFAGGYDTQQDTVTTATADSVGRAVYIVDARTGSLLWWAGKANRESPENPVPDLALAAMDYSIPSTVRVLDVNTDGYADRLYVGDMGGQLWRFDIDNATVDTLANRITGGVIAELQKTSSTAIPGAADNRRFFYPPDVAYVKIPDGQDFLSIAIGSGYRAHPLDRTIEDRFYMIKDYDIYQPPTRGNPPRITYTPIDESRLVDRTELGAREFPGSRGWYIKLNDPRTKAFQGEKVLAEALTFSGTLLFTTFTPVSSGSTSSCAPSQGEGKAYAVDLLTADPVYNYDNLGPATALTRTDRAHTLVRTGLPPEVTVLFPGLADASPVALVGAEKLEVDFSQTPVPTYWYPEQN